MDLQPYGLLTHIRSQLGYSSHVVLHWFHSLLYVSTYYLPICIFLMFVRLDYPLFAYPKTNRRPVQPGAGSGNVRGLYGKSKSQSIDHSVS